MQKIKFHPYIRNCRPVKGGSKTEGYLIYLDGDQEVRLGFSAGDTPIENFVTGGTAGEEPIPIPLIVNGQTIPYENLLEVHFGDSYSAVQEIPDLFLVDFGAATGGTPGQLREVTFDGLTNVTSIGGNFLFHNDNLEKVDMKALDKLGEVKYPFLQINAPLCVVVPENTTELYDNNAYWGNYDVVKEEEQCPSGTILMLGAATPPTCDSCIS